MSQQSKDDFVYTCFDCRRKGFVKTGEMVTVQDQIVCFTMTQMYFDKICFHYKKGKCFNGANCMFSHSNFGRKKKK